MDIANGSWDLSDLFHGPEDSRIDRVLRENLLRATRFAASYEGRINAADLAIETLAAAITEYELIQQEIAKPLAYAMLLFHADTSKPEFGALLQRVQERHSRIVSRLLFFELELAAVGSETIDELLSDPTLARYSHFVRRCRLLMEHRLSEPEERILEEKANSGSRALQRLYMEWLSGIEFRVDTGGEELVLREPEIWGLLSDPDRDLRRRAASALTEGLVRNGRLFTFILNALVSDRSSDWRLRHYDYPEQARHIANELDQETVETVVGLCVDSYPLCQRYYRIKRDILGVDKLTHYDRDAPLFAPTRRYSFDEAREIVLRAFGKLSPTVRDIAAQFFERRWIDAAPRPGKRGGAFCEYVSADHHPYVLLSYHGRDEDLTMLAHELGHGVHACLSRPTGQLSLYSSLPVAELASTFGQMLVFESLTSQASEQEKLALYARKIEDTILLVFRQSATHRFEQELYYLHESRGDLTTDEVGAILHRSLQPMFGDALQLDDDYSCWWMTTVHHVIEPFYPYAYAFGELLVLSLYAKYRAQGQGFVPAYLNLLSTGGSCSPHELLARVDIDITDPHFWRSGLRLIEDMVDEFEMLYRQWSTKEVSSAA